jgi:hypothetical protein
MSAGSVLQKFVDSFASMVASENGAGLAELVKLKNCHGIAKAAVQVNDVVSRDFFFFFFFFFFSFFLFRSRFFSAFLTCGIV